MCKDFQSLFVSLKTAIKKFEDRLLPERCENLDEQENIPILLIRFLWKQTAKVVFCSTFSTQKEYSSEKILYQKHLENFFANCLKLFHKTEWPFENLIFYSDVGVYNHTAFNASAFFR